jgi:hypothetical protein
LRIRPNHVDLGNNAHYADLVSTEGAFGALDGRTKPAFGF